jgi:DNA polymerase I-like protein with 3'-5' exonuclease and polymerase domains
MKFPELDPKKPFAYDTETDGLSWARGDRVFMFSISDAKRDFYFDLRKTPSAKRWVNNLFSKQKAEVICHNASFDYAMSLASGINIPLHLLDDTCIRASLVNENLYSYRLDDLAKKYLKATKDHGIYEVLSAMFGGNPTAQAQGKNLQHGPSDLVGKYAMQDTRLTFDLWQKQNDQCKREDLYEIFKFERDLMPAVIRNEVRGVRVDEERVEPTLKHVNKKINKMQRAIDKLAGCEVNPNPCSQTHELLGVHSDVVGWTDEGEDKLAWYTNDGTALESTPAGNACLNARALRRVGVKTPFANSLLELRKWRKMRDTFIHNHIQGNMVGGRLYPSVNQTKGVNGGTGTGRFSYSKPALQQISKRDKELAEVIRPLFMPEENSYWSSRDWGQSDFRWFVHYLGSNHLIKAYEEDAYMDFHQLCSDITGIPRNAPFAGAPYAKAINLGMIMGMGEGRSAYEMGMDCDTELVSLGGSQKIMYVSPPEGKAVFRKYHSNIKGIKKFRRKAIKVAESRGYVRTIAKRHLHLNKQTSYKAAAFLFQSATAEMLKQKYLEVDDMLEREGQGSIIMTVHDEINCSIPNDRPDIDAKVRDIMVDVKNCSVPIATSWGKGKNWWDANLNDLLEVDSRLTNKKHKGALVYA